MMTVLSGTPLPSYLSQVRTFSIPIYSTVACHLHLPLLCTIISSDTVPRLRAAPLRFSLWTTVAPDLLFSPIKTNWSFQTMDCQDHHRCRPIHYYCCAPVHEFANASERHGIRVQEEDCSQPPRITKNLARLLPHKGLDGVLPSPKGFAMTNATRLCTDFTEDHSYKYWRW